MFETIKSDFRITLYLNLRKNKQEAKPIAQELVERYLYFSKSFNSWIPRHKAFLYWDKERRKSQSWSNWCSSKLTSLYQLSHSFPVRPDLYQPAQSAPY
jgi:hypothetical protein